MLSAARGYAPTTFVDASGTTSASAGTFVQALPGSTGNGIFTFARISNNNASGTLSVYDKTGTPTLGNSMLLNPGQSYSWDLRVSTQPVMVAGSSASMTFEGCLG